MTDVRVQTADAAGARQDAFAVRRVVFVDEQDVDEDLEWDDWDDDPATAHFVAYAASDDEEGDELDGVAGGAGETPVGAARLRPKDRDAGDVGKVERVAVLEAYRGSGVGRALMAELERVGRERGFGSFFLHSQTTAAEFYATLGYEREGETFEEAGIPHVRMRKPA